MTYRKKSQMQEGTGLTKGYGLHNPTVRNKYGKNVQLLEVYMVKLFNNSILTTFEFLYASL